MTWLHSSKSNIRVLGSSLVRRRPEFTLAQPVTARRHSSNWDTLALPVHQLPYLCTWVAEATLNERWPIFYYSVSHLTFATTVSKKLWLIDRAYARKRSGSDCELLSCVVLFDSPVYSAINFLLIFYTLLTATISKNNDDIWSVQLTFIFTVIASPNLYHTKLMHALTADGQVLV